MAYISIILLLVAISVASAFHSYSPLTRGSPVSNVRLPSTTLHVLSKEALSQLDDIKAKYDRLTNVVSPEATEEMQKLESIVQKIKSYKEVRIMMSKFKIMLKSEVSETRKAKQLNSFISLMKGKIELEEVLKEYLGLPFDKTPKLPESLTELEKIDQQIAELQTKLKEKEIKIPQGMSTREERFLLN